jgi:putative ABC transport system ATP-binding protein
MKIHLQHISLRLGDKQVFEDFNLEIEADEKVLIRGPSGSGKSTLLRLILGFVRPDEGTVRLNGEALSEDNVWALRRRVGFVSQDLHIGMGQVREFIREVFSYRANRDLSYDEAGTLELFDRFRLEHDKLTQNISKLSGGEKQRIALIVSLLLDREVYLLDEVTSSIDEALRETVIEYLAGMEGKTMVVVSHDRGWEGFRKVELEGVH